MKRNYSKSVVLTLNATSAKLVNQLHVDRLVTGSIKADRTFKPGQKVTVSYTRDHVRGFSLANPHTRFVGKKTEDAAAASLYVMACMAYEKAEEHPFINQSFYHVNLTRCVIVADDDRSRVVRVDWVDEEFTTFISFRDGNGKCTGQELHELNNKWKARYRGLLHYNGAEVMDLYPEEWAEAISIAKAKALTV